MTDLTCTHPYEILLRAEELRPGSILYFSFSLTFLLTTCFMIGYRLLVKDKSIPKLLFFASLFFYIINVIRLVFFPLPINMAYIDILRQKVQCGLMIGRRNNLELFDFMKWDNLTHITTVGNFLLLLPLGIYVPVLWSQKKWNLFKVAAVGFLVSLTIESTQLLYSFKIDYTYRSFDVDDLMLNTLGAATGYVIYLFFCLLLFLGKTIKKAVAKLGNLF